jgi:hypothetical protein
MGDGESAIKVVIEEPTLHGSNESGSLQKIATVYIGRDEYRVYAPPKASGSPLEWLGNLRVHQPSPIGLGSDIAVDASDSIYVIKLVKEELEKQAKEANAGADVSLAGPYYHVRLYVSEQPGGPASARCAGANRPRAPLDAKK